MHTPLLRITMNEQQRVTVREICAGRDQIMADKASLESLDRLILDAGGAGDAGKHSKSGHGLLIEHLRSARSSLLGAMPGEYRSSLQEAKESAACIADKTTQVDIQQRLRKLVAD